MNNPPMFGVDPTDTVPQVSSLRGMSGYFTVPTQWYVWTDSERRLWCSPNESHEPAFGVTMDEDLTMKFFDLYRNTQLGNTWG